MLASVTMFGYSANKNSQSKVTSLINEYRQHNGFSCINIGRLGLATLKTVARIAADEEDKKDLDMLMELSKDIKKITLVDYEDCPRNIRDRFSERMATALEGSSLLMEVKDEEDNISIYGVPNENGSVISDLVIFSPNEYKFIRLLGKFSIDTVMDIQKKMEDDK